MKKLIWLASIFSLALTTSCKPSSGKNESQNDQIAAGDTLKGEISFRGHSPFIRWLSNGRTNFVNFTPMYALTYRGEAQEKA